jgi:hypothetical protein
MSRINTDIIKKKGQSILMLRDDDPKAESDFEIEFMLSLPPALRYKMMSRLVRQGLKMKSKNETKKTPALISRT